MGLVSPARPSTSTFMLPQKLYKVFKFYLVLSRKGGGVHPPPPGFARLSTDARLDHPMFWCATYL